MIRGMIRSISAAGVTLAGLALVSCFEDSGIVDPGNPENIQFLAAFQGKAINQDDTTLSAKKILRVPIRKRIVV
jgi:hypothetical protein